LRKAVRYNRAAVYTANPVETKSADISIDELIYKPDTEAAFLIGLTHAIIDNKLYKNIDDNKAAEIKAKLNPAGLTEAARLCGIEPERIVDLARALSAGQNVFILSGEFLKASQHRHIISNGLYNLANLLGVEDGKAAILASHANSTGADRVGLRPRLSQALTEKLAARWGAPLPDSPGCGASQIFKGALNEEIDSVFIMGANPAMRYPDGPFVNAALDKLDFLVVADLFETATSAKADVVLPLAGWSEQSGSYVNLEGRYQRFDKALPPKKGIRTGIEILRALAAAMESPLSLDDKSLTAETKEVVDGWKRAPRDSGRFFEIKQPAPLDHSDYPYRLFIGNDLHHFGYLTEHCPSLMRFTPEAYLELSPNLAKKLNISDGHLIRVESSTGKLVLKAKLSEFFEGEVLFIPNNFSSVEVSSLMSREGGGWVKIEKLDDK